MTVTELSIKRPTLIAMVFAALAVLGIYSYTQLDYELLPKISPPVITIAAVYPGASPYEIEANVTKRIEDAISTLDEIDAINSTSAEGISFVVIEFNQSVNVDVALQNAQRRVNEIVSLLPEGVKAPTISKFALDEIPIIRMGAISNLSSKEFYELLKDRIKPRFSQLEGVGQITMIGGDEREIKINLDADKLRSYGISIAQVTHSIKTSNLDFPMGKIENSSEQLIVRLAGKFNSLEELRSLIVGRSKAGGEIKLSDVAEVYDGQKDYKNISRINGITSVGIIVQKQSDANAVEVSKLVKSEIAMLESEFADFGLKFDVAQDGSRFTIDAANAVKFDLMLAVIMVALVMLLFLHSIRNSFIVLLAIPASMISVFIVMYALGYTLNLMTLLGLSLVVGILVDDSIVVLENIYHHLEKGEAPRTAALKGRNEIGFAALAITLVDIAVFVPLALTGGMIGNIIRQFAVVVVISTLMSLFVSFTVTPLLASRISKLERLTKKTFIGRFAAWFENGFKKLSDHYNSILKWSLQNKKKVVSMTIVLFISSFLLIPFGFIGNEFITQSDQGEFAVMLELQPGSSLENTNYVTQQVEKKISSIPEVKKIFVNVGASNEGLVGQSANNIAELNVSLVHKNDRSRSTMEIGNEIKEYISSIPGVKSRVSPIGLFGTADETPIQLIVSGTNREDVKKGAEIVYNVVRRIPGTADVRLSSSDGKPETRIEIDRAKLSAFGLSIAEVGAALRIALAGDEDSKFRDGDNEYNIKIALDKFDRQSISDISGLSFFNRKGEAIELQQFADIYQATGPTKLQRRERINSVVVLSQVNGRPSGSIGEDIKAAMAVHPLPAGVELHYHGELKRQAESFASLGLAMIAGILFVYMILVALYDSYIYPFVILFSIPVAMVGALLALALMMKSLSIFSILGIIVLIGLVGKNAILLVDRANVMKQEGMNAYDAILEAGKSRLRPIFMTTATMVTGMMPIALSTSSGAEWKTGLAWALVGGLTSSMFLTLILVPIIYVKADAWKETVPAFFKRLFGRKEKRAPLKPVMETGDN